MTLDIQIVVCLTCKPPGAMTARGCQLPDRGPSVILISAGTRSSHEVDMGGDWADASDQLGNDPGALVDARLEAMLGAATGPVNWRTVTAEDASEHWSELREWVDWFRGEFAFDHRVVPPCWYRHPALVSVLSALRDHWTCAYDPLNTPAGAADWHRSFMQFEPRLRDWASRTGCAVGAHRPDVVVAYQDDDDDWAAHMAADAAVRTRRETAGNSTGGQQVFVMGVDER